MGCPEGGAARKESGAKGEQAKRLKEVDESPQEMHRHAARPWVGFRARVRVCPSKVASLNCLCGRHRSIHLACFFAKPVTSQPHLPQGIQNSKGPAWVTEWRSLGSVGGAR